MNLLHWNRTDIGPVAMFSNDVIPEYEIKQADNTFFVVRTVAECDDIGPLETFQEADAIVMQMGLMLSSFEEQAWRTVAAKALKVDTVGLLTSDSSCDGGKGWETV